MLEDERRIIMAKYEKPMVEVVKLDADGFMTASGNNSNSLVDGYCGTYAFTGSLGEMGYSCSSYTVGGSCNPFNTNGYSCSSYNGETCSTYVYNGKTYTNYGFQNCNHF